MDKNSIFLTMKEAVDAITIDFHQYEPQILLFCSIIGLISENDIRFQRETGRDGVWINQRGRSNMRWLEGPDLIEYMCTAIRATRWTREQLAVVCRRVFQCRVKPMVDPETGREGLMIDTQMASFECRQCGRCCRSLDYHHEVTAADVEHWRALGRRDILRWVDTAIRKDETAAYRMWVMPGTQQLAETCPFLRQEPTTNLWGCTIHAVKPQICRNYPVSRKHAIMTGCRGFERPRGK